MVSKSSKRCLILPSWIILLSRGIWILGIVGFQVLVVRGEMMRMMIMMMIIVPTTTTSAFTFRAILASSSSSTTTTTIPSFTNFLNTEKGNANNTTTTKNTNLSYFEHEFYKGLEQRQFYPLLFSPPLLLPLQQLPSSEVRQRRRRKNKNGKEEENNQQEEMMMIHNATNQRNPNVLFSTTTTTNVHQYSSGSIDSQDLVVLLLQEEKEELSSLHTLPGVNKIRLIVSQWVIDNENNNNDSIIQEEEELVKKQIELGIMIWKQLGNDDNNEQLFFLKEDEENEEDNVTPKKGFSEDRTTTTFSLSTMSTITTTQQQRRKRKQQRPKSPLPIDNSTPSKRKEIMITTIEQQLRMKIQNILFNQFGWRRHRGGLHTHKQQQQQQQQPTFEFHIVQCTTTRYQLELTVLDRTYPLRQLQEQQQQEQQSMIPSKNTRSKSTNRGGRQSSSSSSSRRRKSRRRLSRSVLYESKRIESFVVAYAANIQPGDCVLDPMCGRGTFLIEAAKYWPLGGGDEGGGGGEGEDRDHYDPTDSLNSVAVMTEMMSTTQENENEKITSASTSTTTTSASIRKIVQYYGVDKSIPHLEHAKMNADSTYTILELKHCQSIFSIPYPNESMDIIMTCVPFGKSIIYYQRLLQEWSRVLKKKTTTTNKTKKYTTTTSSSSSHHRHRRNNSQMILVIDQSTLDCFIKAIYRVQGCSISFIRSFFSWGTKRVTIVVVDQITTTMTMTSMKKEEDDDHNDDNDILQKDTNNIPSAVGGGGSSSRARNPHYPRGYYRPSLQFFDWEIKKNSTMVDNSGSLLSSSPSPSTRSYLSSSSSSSNTMDYRLNWMELRSKTIPPLVPFTQAQRARSKPTKIHL